MPIDAEMSDAIAIHPLTSARWADLAALFEEGGDPKWCWCQFYRVRGLDWSNSSADGNRERLATLTRTGRRPVWSATRTAGPLAG